MRASGKTGSFSVRVALGITAALLVAGPGCSSVPVVDTGQKGLLQSGTPSPYTIRTDLPIAIAPKATESSDAGFVWPLRKGKITSLFGLRKRDFHEGIDIRANRGTPIYAAKEGVVIYSARRIRGYGNMIVVKHDDSWATVYAHNRKNLVKRGQRVTQGQLLAYVGATGKATGPHLHFEIRKGELPQDPLLYLPQIRPRHGSQNHKEVARK